MIKINFNFTDGTEVSYLEGCELKDDFTTNCLDFFNNDEKVDDVIVVDKQGNILSRKLLMSNKSEYTNRDMREEHNLQKMLKANAFNWR
jgi:hypothetical protein